MRWFRRILLLFLVVVATALGGLYLLLQTADPARLAADGARQLGLVLGQPVRFDDAPAIGFWPVPGVHAGTVRTDGGAVQGGTAVIVPDPVGLILGRSRVLGVVLIGAELGLDRASGLALLGRGAAPPDGATLGYLGLLAGRIVTGSADGPVSRVSALATLGGRDRRFALRLSGDWRGRPVALTLAAADPRLLFDRTGTEIDANLDLGDDMIAFRGLLGFDSETGRITSNGLGSVRLGDPQAAASLLGLRLPALAARVSEVEGAFESRTLNSALRVKTNLAARFDDRTISLQATVSGEPGWRDTGPTSINLVSRGGGLFSAYLSGEFDGPDRLAGSLTVSVADMQGVQDLLGVPADGRLIEMSRGTLRADYMADADGIRLSGGEIRMGERAVATTFGIKFGTRPMVSVGLDLPDLDLTAAHAAAYTRLRTTLAHLGSAGADLALTVRAARTVLGDIALGSLDLGLTHRDGVASIELGRLEVMGGLANGRLQLATSGPARLTGEIALAEVDAGALARLAGLGLVGGTAGGIGRIDIPDLESAGPEGARVTGEMTITDGRLWLPVAPDDAIVFQSASLGLALADGLVTARDVRLRRTGSALAGELAVVLKTRALSGHLALPDGSGFEIGGTVEAPTARPARIIVAMAARTGGAEKQRGDGATADRPADATTADRTGAADPASGGAPGGGSGPNADRTGGGTAAATEPETRLAGPAVGDAAAGERPAGDLTTGDAPADDRPPSGTTPSSPPAGDTADAGTIAADTTAAGITPGDRSPGGTTSGGAPASDLPAGGTTTDDAVARAPADAGAATGAADVAIARPAPAAVSDEPAPARLSVPWKTLRAALAEQARAAAAEAAEREAADTANSAASNGSGSIAAANVPIPIPAPR